MRPSVRLLKPLEVPSLRGSRKALYVCSVCRQDASSCLPSSTQRRHASGSGSTPFTEKLRRRIWGTDNPPGLEDPYGGEGVIAKEWAKRKARYTGAKETSAETGRKNEIQQRTEDEFQGENLLGEEFISATAAHDLPRIGHLSQWNDFPPTESDLYQPFVSRKKAMTSAHFRSAAQSVVVELGLLHELKKPLTAACTVPRHDETIWEMIRQCQVKESSILESRGNFLEFPDQETKDTLFFVFNQLEEPQKTQNENVMAAVNEADPSESDAVREIDEEEAENEFHDQYPHNEWEESADLEALDAESEPTFEFDLTPEQLNETVDTVFSQVLETKKPPQHEGYLQFSLSDPAVKFAFFKRYSQITGHHMQDICAYKAQTVQDVITHVEKIYCRRTKLAQELRALKDELDIPNLQVHFKRYTKGSHDRDIGRAKLVEEALRERGLLKEQHNKQSKFRL